MTVPKNFLALDAFNKSRAAKRHDKVLAAASALARVTGFQHITRSEVAARAGVAAASVSHAFGSMIDLKQAVLRHAIETEDVTIVAQGLTDRPGGHPLVKDISDSLRERAARSLIAS